MVETNLTDEQKRFLEECEEEFKDRYTEKDSEFMRIKNMEAKKPPIVDHWHGRNKRFNNRERDGRSHHQKFRQHHRYRPYYRK